MTTSRSISLYHTSQLKIPKQCKLSSSFGFFHNSSSNFQNTFPLFYSMQLELYFKREYVCKIPSRRLKQFRHILRKDNELAHLLHVVTYVTASDIKNFATNLQIYESFLISKKSQTMKHIHQLQIFFNYFYFSLIPNFSP